MARYWLGPWEWESADGAAYWRAPLLAESCLDLRSNQACGLTGTVSGFGLFTTLDGVDLGRNYENLGTDLLGAWNPSARARWRSALRLPGFSANNLRDAIWETLTVQSDPTGEDRAKPLVPSHSWYELWLAGQKIQRKEFSVSDPESAPLFDLLKRDYRQVRKESLSIGDERHYRKVLGYLVRKYGVGYRAFQPADVPNEEPLTPETTWTETWPTNGTTITTGQDQPWTEALGDATVTSGTIRAGQLIRCDTALSGSDNYCQAVYSLDSTGTTRLAGPAFRYAAASNDCYMAAQAGGASGSGTYRPYKVVSAVLTALGSGSSQTQSATKKGSASGTTIEIYQNGASVESITDSTHSVGVRCGISWSNSLSTVQAFDNVEAGDLAAPSGNRRRRVIVCGEAA